MTTNKTTLEVVDDNGAAWRECGPDGCTISRQRLSGKACNAARAALAEFAAVIGLAATALRWTIPVRWESKRRKRRARGRQREARRKEARLWRSLTNPSLGQPWEASDDA